MTGYAMCAGSGKCPKAASCGRAPESGAKPSEAQPWAYFAPVKLAAGGLTCMHWMRAEDRVPIEARRAAKRRASAS